MSTPPVARPLRWWDLAAVVVVIVLSVMAAFEVAAGSPLWAIDQPASTRIMLVLLPILAFVALYVILGRRVLRRAMAELAPDATAILFLALMLLLVVGAVATLPIFAVLQMLAYPMAWIIVTQLRNAVLWSAGIALAAGGGLILAIGSVNLQTALTSAGITTSLSFAFAVGMGAWITGIANKGEEYRALAEQLRESQAEVAALSSDAGAAAERERLSRELHDTLTQTLAGLVMLSEQAERAFSEGEADRARDRVRRVGEAAREAVVEARALVATTQPLGDGGLEAAIERVARRFAEDTGVRVDLRIESVALDRERQVMLLRAAQEGLANARKHARASSVVVVLAAASGGGTILRVEDDGVGPEVHSAGSAGFGLSGLGDRVRAVGGTVTFAARAAGSGAVLEVCVPASEPEGAS